MDISMNALIMNKQNTFKKMFYRNLRDRYFQLKNICMYKLLIIFFLFLICKNERVQKRKTRRKNHTKNHKL